MGDERLELSRLAPTDPKSALSTSFSNRPNTCGGKYRIPSRVDDTSATRLLSRQFVASPIWASGFHLCSMFSWVDTPKLLAQLWRGG